MQTPAPGAPPQQQRPSYNGVPGPGAYPPGPGMSAGAPLAPNGPPMPYGAMQPPTQQFGQLGIGGAPGQPQAGFPGAAPQPGLGPRPAGPTAGPGMPMQYGGPASMPGGLAGAPAPGMIRPTGPAGMPNGPLMAGPGMPQRPPGIMGMPRPMGPASVPGAPVANGMGMHPANGMGMPPPNSVGMHPANGMGMPPPPNGMGMPPANGMAMPPAAGGYGRPGPPGPPGMMPPGPQGMPPPGPQGMPPHGPPGMPPPGPPGMMPHGPPGMPLGPPGMPPGPPGMMPPGPPGMGALAQQNMNQQRIDPASIPRPVISTSTGTVTFETRTPGQPSVPPSAASRFVVRDRGNAGPRYMRSTLNQVPHTADLVNCSAMPLAVVVSPLALPEPDDDQIQLVDLGELGPVRCERCKAYMNPFMRFMSSGRTFTCNFCGHSNQTPEAYFCHLGPDGLRRDVYERPELHRGSVEYAATAAYMIRPPMPSSHFFIIDATPAAVSSGALASVCSCISRVLDDMPNPERSMVGLATFDSVVQFYSVQPGSSQPHMLIVSDINEVFVPDSAPLLLRVSEHREALQTLLEQIPTMFNATRSNDSCAGAGIEAAIAALQPSGGKVHAFLTSLPSVGVHALKLRDGGGVGDKDKLAVLASADDKLKTLALLAADFQVCVDISLLAQGYMDIASLSDLTTATGGTMYQYTPFNPALDHDQVLNDLKWNVERPQGMEAVMRVRCSQGLEVDTYLGAFCRQPANPTDMYLPAIDCDKAILAMIKHTDKLSPGADCYLQAALLYTSVDGFRRIRVHTLALPIVDNVSALFKTADLDAQTLCMARRMAASLPNGTLLAAREAATNNTVATLAAYRKYCASQSSAVQLILPEALKLLPLYALSLLKGPALRDSVKLDERALWISQMMSLPCARISPLLYPRLLPLGGMLSGGETLSELPAGVVLSSEGLEQGGVYLLENGYEALLHLDKSVDPGLVQQLLGVSGYEELLRVSQPLVLLPRDTPASRALQDLLVKVRIHRSSFLRLRITRKGDPHEARFMGMLVEDRHSSAGMSYVEYLCSVHRHIQLKLQ